jgi:bifunctional non-homologous end joining protein LigD
MKQVSGLRRRAPGRSAALPAFVEPMLARPGAVPRDDDWALEVKFDAMRAQLRWDGRAIRLRSRPGRDCTSEFPELGALGEALGGDSRIGPA